MGGGANVAEDMRRMENEKQRRGQAVTDQINRLFNDPAQQALYDQQQKAVTGLNQQEVARQYDQAHRVNRYGLARAGLMGGQADIDSEAELSRLNAEGGQKALMLGQNAANDLQAADKRAQQQLIQAAPSGLDIGQAEQMANAAMQQTANQAAANSHAATIGNLFNDLSWAYLTGPQMAGQRAGQNAYSQALWPDSPYRRYAGR